MRKSLLSVVPAVVTTVTLLTACSGGDDSTTRTVDPTDIVTADAGDESDAAPYDESEDSTDVASDGSLENCDRYWQDYGNPDAALDIYGSMFEGRDPLEGVQGRVPDMPGCELYDGVHNASIPPLERLNRGSAETSMSVYMEDHLKGSERTQMDTFSYGRDGTLRYLPEVQYSFPSVYKNTPGETICAEGYREYWLEEYVPEGQEPMGVPHDLIYPGGALFLKLPAEVSKYDSDSAYRVDFRDADLPDYVAIHAQDSEGNERVVYQMVKGGYSPAHALSYEAIEGPMLMWTMLQSSSDYAFDLGGEDDPGARVTGASVCM